METNYKYLKVNSKENILSIQIDNPKSLNALSTEMLKELYKVFTIAGEQKEIRVVIITGTDRSFVAGADISEMSNFTPEEAKDFGKLGSSVFMKIEKLPQPVIAAVNGFALGGGCELAMACDLRIASEKAKFGQPEVGLGITPGFSGTQRLPRLVGEGIAKEMIYTGQYIRADEALRVGLVNRIVKHEDLNDAALSLAKVIAAQAPIAVQYAKEAINKGVELGSEKGADNETRLFSLCFDTEDQKQGMKSFLNKEKITFKGK